MDVKQIVLPDTQVPNLEGLEMLCEGLSRHTGAKIEIGTQVVVSTTCIPAFFALKDLLEKVKPAQAAPAQEPAEAGEARRESGKLYPEDFKPPSPDGRKKPRGKWVQIWDVVGTGEKISKAELERRLVEHEFKPGQRLHHPRQGYMVVTKSNDPDESDQLVEAGDWKGDRL